MASSKLMASSQSRNSDLNRKLSPCASTSSAADFLRIGSSINNARDNFESYYVELNSGADHGQGLGAEAESSSSTLLSADIMLLDAAGAIAPISDGELEPRRIVRKTVDDVWREIVAGKQREKQPKEEMMTLEDFLMKAGAVEGSSPATREFLKVKEERLSGGMCLYESKSGVIGSEVGGMGLDVGDLGRRRGKRSLSLLEPLDKVAQQRQRRMIKNRESAARSRERKQAYQVELESIAMRLEEENSRLLKEKAEQSKKRLKQLMENVIPVVEKRKPPRLQRVRSMQW